MTRGDLKNSNVMLPPQSGKQMKPMRIGIEAQRIFRPKKHGMDVVAIELIRNLQEIDNKSGGLRNMIAKRN